MGLLDGIERLVSEHGSAAILREGIALAREQYAAIESSAAELRKDNDRLKSANADLKVRVRGLERQLSEVPPGIDSEYACDHCGSRKLRRTGNRPDPTFGDLGVKQAVFSCLDCCKESAFTQQPSP